MASTKTVIKNGLVIDPLNGIDKEPLDILIVNGQIAKVSPSILTPGEKGGTTGDSSSWNIFDASGCLVTPGLIDMHVHCYPSRTSLGIDPDLHCLARGVTTVVDAGSAGTSPHMCMYLYTQDGHMLF